MQRAVRPNPVAAMLEAPPGRFSRTLHRSCTIPVFGLPCSQKNKKLALSTSCRNWSSSDDKAGLAGLAGVAGVAGLAGLAAVFCCGLVCPRAGSTRAKVRDRLAPAIG